MRAKPKTTITEEKLRASNLIVLLESEVFELKKYARKTVVLLFAIYRGVANQIRVFACISRLV